ncbi:15843_t:CDS:2, partial [Acaulospora colombiana]
SHWALNRVQDTFEVMHGGQRSGARIRQELQRHRSTRRREYRLKLISDAITATCNSVSIDLSGLPTPNMPTLGAHKLAPTTPIPISKSILMLGQFSYQISLKTPKNRSRYHSKQVVRSTFDTLPKHSFLRIKKPGLQNYRRDNGRVSKSTTVAAIITIILGRIVWNELKFMRMYGSPDYRPAFNPLTVLGMAYGLGLHFNWEQRSTLYPKNGREYIVMKPWAWGDPILYSSSVEILKQTGGSGNVGSWQKPE